MGEWKGSVSPKYEKWGTISWTISIDSYKHVALLLSCNY